MISAENKNNIDDTCSFIYPNGGVIPSSSSIDKFLAGIRNNPGAVNLPPTPSYPTRKTQPKIKPTHILQINLQHSKIATANLAKKSESKDFSICLVQEPWVTKKGLSGIPPQIVKQHGLIREGDPPIRVAILHTRSHNIWPIHYFSDRDTCTCVWNSRNRSGSIKEIWLISAYWSSQTNNIPSKFKQTI